MNTRALLLFLVLLLPAGASALPQNTSELLARAFLGARRLRAAERLALAATLASAPERRDLSRQDPQALLPKEEELSGALWVALFNAKGELLASRGKIPEDLGERVVVRRALAAFLRDDLIDSQDGPLYVAAAPLGKGGQVAGALVIAWPEALGLDELAARSCGCQALLFSQDQLITGDPSFSRDAEALRKEADPKPTLTGIVVPPRPLPEHPTLEGALVLLPGEISGVYYLLLFPIESPPPSFSKVDILLGLFGGLALLSGALLLLSWLLSRRGAPSGIGKKGDLLAARLPSLYQEFIAAKVRCGEDIEHLDEAHFTRQVREAYGQLVALHGQPRLKLNVVVKNGRAQIVATPDKTTEIQES